MNMEEEAAASFVTPPSPLPLREEEKVFFPTKLCHFPQRGTFGWSPNISEFFCSFWVIHLTLGFWMGIRPGNIHSLKVPGWKTECVQSKHLGVEKKNGLMFMFVSCHRGRCLHSFFPFVVSPERIWEENLHAKTLNFRKGFFKMDSCWLWCESYSISNMALFFNAEFA